MTQLLLFLLAGLAGLMVLGHLSTPRGERLPVRRWTPVYLMDRIPYAVKLFQDAGARQRGRFEDAAAERESTAKGQSRSEDDLNGNNRNDRDSRNDGNNRSDPRGRT